MPATSAPGTVSNAQMAQSAAQVRTLESTVGSLRKDLDKVRSELAAERKQGEQQQQELKRLQAQGVPASPAPALSPAKGSPAAPATMVRFSDRLANASPRLQHSKSLEVGSALWGDGGGEQADPSSPFLTRWLIFPL